MVKNINDTILFNYLEKKDLFKLMKEFKAFHDYCKKNNKQTFL